RGETGFIHRRNVEANLLQQPCEVFPVNALVIFLAGYTHAVSRRGIRWKLDLTVRSSAWGTVRTATPSGDRIRCNSRIASKSSGTCSKTSQAITASNEFSPRAFIRLMFKRKSQAGSRKSALHTGRRAARQDVQPAAQGRNA